MNRERDPPGVESLARHHRLEDALGRGEAPHRPRDDGQLRLYYNRGYLEYRKSVIEMRDEPALEWEGQGSLLYDLTGRRFIDCLGGYGIYSAGIRHPKIVKAVADQLARMPLSSQELIDPLRGALAELLGEIAPGDLQYSFFINNGTDAVEGAYKLARLLHRADQLHLVDPRLPRQERAARSR